MIKEKLVLNHDMVRILLKDNSYLLSIRMRSGGWIAQAPYPGDQRGLLGAMTLAIDVLAGKVLLLGVEASEKDNKALNAPAFVALEGD